MRYLIWKMPIDLSGLVVLARVCICNHGVEVQYGINQKAHVLAAFCFMMIRCFSAAKRWIWRGVKAMRHSDCPSHGRDDRQIRQIKKSAKRSLKKTQKTIFHFSSFTTCLILLKSRTNYVNSTIKWGRGLANFATRVCSVRLHVWHRLTSVQFWCRWIPTDEFTTCMIPMSLTPTAMWASTNCRRTCESPCSWLHCIRLVSHLKVRIRVLWATVATTLLFDVMVRVLSFYLEFFRGL